MKVENIPVELTLILPARAGGSCYPDGYTDLFTKEFPLGEDKTSDTILIETYLSLQIKN